MASQSPPANFPLLFQQAVQLHQTGNLAAAERLYLELLAAAPGNFDVNHMFGILRAQQGRFGEALERIDAALAVNRKSLKAWLNHGNVLRDLKRPEDALTSYAKALAINPNDVDSLLGRGAMLRGLGRFEEALACYGRILAIQPGDLRALNNRGNIFLDQGAFADALASFDRALAVKPDDVLVLANRGNALRGLDRYDEALASCDRALALKPDLAEALQNRAGILHQLGRLDEALASSSRAIALKPGDAGAHYNHGNILRDLKRAQDALASYDKAVRLQPGLAAAFNNRGNVLVELARTQEALENFDQAIAIEPYFADAYNNRGNALNLLKQAADALVSFDQAIQLNPQDAQAHGNRGIALQGLGLLDEALESFDRGIALKADMPEVFSNRGNVLKDLGRFEEAEESFDKAIALNPDYVGAHLNKGLCALLQGRFEQGLPLYEWRRKGRQDTGLPDLAQPLWLGEEDISGKRLLLHAEQGYGDTLQFCRYAALAQARGAKVILAVQDGLVRLLQGLEAVSANGPLPDFDYHLPLLSAPLAFGTDRDNIPAEIPYLHAEPDRIRAWGARIGPAGFKIGIAWQGNRQHAADIHRSFGLRNFEGLSKMPGVRLISLQKNDGTDQLGDLPPGMKVETLGDDFDSGADAFVDTAAVMQNLDLIVTTDTAIAHLAGALGRPAWVALAPAPDWRWFLGRTDSPWYPGMHLFRQPAWGDWESVFAEMQARLSGML